MGFTVKRVLRRVLRSGSEKGFSRRCLERPLGEYAPLGVRPKLVLSHFRGLEILWGSGGVGGFQGRKPNKSLSSPPSRKVQKCCLQHLA